jgi:hypothetical protein
MVDYDVEHCEYCRDEFHEDEERYGMLDSAETELTVCWGCMAMYCIAVLEEIINNYLDSYGGDQLKQRIIKRLEIPKVFLTIPVGAGLPH